MVLHAPSHPTLQCELLGPRATETQVPASFAGSEEGTTVTLNVGDYNVTEDFEDNASSPLKVVRHFSADCSGSIETAGESRECNVTNEFVVKEYLFLGKWGSLAPATASLIFRLALP